MVVARLRTGVAYLCTNVRADGAQVLPKQYRYDPSNTVPRRELLIGLAVHFFLLRQFLVFLCGIICMISPQAGSFVNRRSKRNSTIVTRDSEPKNLQQNTVTSSVEGPKTARGNIFPLSYRTEANTGASIAGTRAQKKRVASTGHAKHDRQTTNERRLLCDKGW